MSSGKRGTKIDMLAGSAQLLPTQHPKASATLPALLSSLVGDTPKSASKKLKRPRSPKDDTDHTSSIKMLKLAGLVAVRTFTVVAAEKALYMHGRVRHPNIVKALKAFTTETSFYIVLEYMPISLYQIVESAKYPTESELAAILRQVLDGLIYLESEGLEHSSINYWNILLSTKGNRNREPQDVRALGIIIMELMQKYTQENGAVSVENLDRWPSDSNAVTFLSKITSAAMHFCDMVTRKMFL
ncbi:hypothetical protein VE04_09289 [Pseudogymnoascus sp. 24MN13]|nr:hypothetical protein VE04_09289 [Pseudogymnoascus sp. 24MN13]